VVLPFRGQGLWRTPQGGGIFPNRKRGASLNEGKISAFTYQNEKLLKCGCREYCVDWKESKPLHKRDILRGWGGGWERESFKTILRYSDGVHELRSKTSIFSGPGRSIDSLRAMSGGGKGEAEIGI